MNAGLEDALTQERAVLQAAPVNRAASDILRVLIVEDDPFIGLLYKGMLEREGYTVQHCRDGEGALEVLGRERFDAVVLDLMMPKVDGMQVLKAMRSSPGNALTPVIIVTAARLKVVEEEASRCGARSYLDKTQTARLLSELRQIMSERASVGAPKLRMAKSGSLEPPEPKPVAARPPALASEPPAPRGLARFFRGKPA